MSDDAYTDDIEHRCKRCQAPTEAVSLSEGGRIGWFCWKCDLFHPGEGVNTWPLRTDMERSTNE